ncbi:MAG: aldose epimerase [Opitutaceae bacterium]|nr:aldose epimerase [Opitutaceae bacterium]
MEIVPYLGQNVRRWQVGSSTFLALPEQGARLMHWHLTLADGSVRDVVYWPETSDLKDFHRIRGGNPILFPFNARVFDQGEIHFWRDADGVRRPMAMHGYARQGAFKLVRCDARGFAALFLPSDEAKQAYPYDYEFTVTYRFDALGLACEFSLKNLGKQPIPWSAGHHFYFAVPWVEGTKRTDYTIEIPASRTFRQDTAGNLQPGPKFPPAVSLANPEIVETIHCGLQHNAIRFGPTGQPGEVTVKVGTSKVPHPEAAVVTWTQDDASPFYCVEPWMGPPNAPGHKVGLHWVAPGQTQTFVVEVLAK